MQGRIVIANSRRGTGVAPPPTRIAPVNRPTTKPSRRTVIRAGAGAAVLAAGGLGALKLFSGTEGPRPWVFRTGDEVYSSPAVHRDTVYVASRDGNLYAVDATSGRLRWRYTTGNSIRSSPTVDGEVVYVASRDRNVYAIDTMTGEPRWRYATKGPIDDSSPVVAGGLVVAGSLDHHVYALRTRDGAGG